MKLTVKEFYRIFLVLGVFSEKKTKKKKHGISSILQIGSPSNVERCTLVILSYWHYIRQCKGAAARGHATFIDSKMLSVTKYRIQILLAKEREPETCTPYAVTYCQVVLQNGWHPVCSVCFCWRPSYWAGNLRKSKHRAVVESHKCCTCIRRYFLRIWPATLIGVVPRLVEVLVLVDFAWMAFQYRNW